MSGAYKFKCGVNVYRGQGTTRERPSNPEVAAETAGRLAAMQIERDAQDKIWIQSQTVCQTDNQSQKLDRELPKLAAVTTASQSQGHESLPPWAVQSRGPK